MAIPCYRSAAILPGLVDRITKTVAEHGCACQIILVDDSPLDTDTFPVIARICEENGNVTGIRLSRNFGQQAAKMAALPYVKGDVLVFMDDDGQHPPEEMFKLIDALDEGHDVVYARFAHKRHSLFKRVTSRLRTRLAEVLGSQPKGLSTTAYLAMNRVCVDALLRYESPFPIMSPYIFLVTTNIANVDIDHQARLSGKSGYTLHKLFSLWLSSFTNFSIAPLRLASAFGALTALAGFVYMVVTIIRRLAFGTSAPGYASLMVVLLFLSGVIMITLGLIGEYLGRVYMTVSNKPQYIIRKVIRAGEPAPAARKAAEAQDALSAAQEAADIKQK